MADALNAGHRPCLPVPEPLRFAAYRSVPKCRKRPLSGDVVRIELQSLPVKRSRSLDLSSRSIHLGKSQERQGAGGRLDPRLLELGNGRLDIADPSIRLGESKASPE